MCGYVAQGIYFLQQFAVQLNHNIVGAFAFAQKYFSVKSMQRWGSGSTTVQTAVGSGMRREDPSEALGATLADPSMQDSASELRRTTLLGT